MDDVVHSFASRFGLTEEEECEVVVGDDSHVRVADFLLVEIFGVLEPVFLYDCLGEFLRVGVAIDVFHPLRRLLKVRLPNRSRVDVDLLYEKLPAYCFLCGRRSSVLTDPTSAVGGLVWVRMMPLWIWMLSNRTRVGRTSGIGDLDMECSGIPISSPDFRDLQSNQETLVGRDPCVDPPPITSEPIIALNSHVGDVTETITHGVPLPSEHMVNLNGNETLNLADLHGPINCNPSEYGSDLPNGPPSPNSLDPFNLSPIIRQICSPPEGASS
ncbi:hypothetical protein COP1_044201 [Malus domestica]